MLFFNKKSPEVKIINDMNNQHKGDKYAKFNDNNLVIDIKKVTKSYVNNNFVSTILKGIDLQIYEGEFVVILGPSGSGKTTLMNIISGLDRATSGYVNILGSNLINLDDDELTNFRRMNIGYIFQQYGLIPSLNAKENINIGEYLSSKNKKDIKNNFEKEKKFIQEFRNKKLQDFINLRLSENEIFLSNMDFNDYIHFVFFAYSKKDNDIIASIINNDYALNKFNNELEQYCQEWNYQVQYRFNKEIAKANQNNIDYVMQNLGIDQLAKKYPSEMSGGQQQRISIARSLLKNPSILFADEPTGAVDLKMNDIILKNFKDINKTYNTTVVIVTHNPDIAKLATKVIHFSDGKIKKIINQIPQE